MSFRVMTLWLAYIILLEQENCVKFYSNNQIHMMMNLKILESVKKTKRQALIDNFFSLKKLYLFIKQLKFYLSTKLDVFWNSYRF